MSSDTKVDPWALLREARECVVGRCNTGLLDRIDSALAAHESEERVEVEWKMGDDCTEDFQFYEAYPDDHTGLDVVRFKDGKWRWTACREVEEQGYCDTLDEAKSAAIAAARGMR